MPPSDPITFPFPFCLFSRGHPKNRLWPIACGMASAMWGLGYVAALLIVAGAVALREAYRFAKVLLMLRVHLRANGRRARESWKWLRPRPLYRYTAPISPEIASDMVTGALTFWACRWVLA